MKKVLFFLAAFCAAAVVSCTNKELAVDTPAEEGVSNVKLIPITIIANFEGTKADMAGEDGITWTWKSGDKLAVYDGISKREFSLDQSSDGQAIAKFTGNVAENFTSLKAVFPYSAAGESFGTPIIPSNQVVSDGATIDPAAMIAIAERAEKDGNDYTFYFTSGVSMLRFTVPAGVQKVILHAEGKEATIAGESRSVTVTVPGEGRFWAAVNPASYEGLKVFSRTSDGDFMKSTTATIDLSAPGKAKNLGTLGAAGTEVAVIENGDELISYLGSETAPTLDAYLVNDLDLTSKTVASCAEYAKVFDGLYHSIKNWTSNQVSMFAKVTGAVKKLTLDSTCSFTAPMGGNFAPVVVILSGGTVSEVINKAPITANGTFTAQRSLAGIVARMEVKTSVVEDCHNFGAINSEFKIADTKATQYIGGVVGAFIAPSTIERIKKCTNNGNITISGSEENSNLRNVYIGGIVGVTGMNSGTADAPSGYTKNYGTVSNCVNNGNISVTWGGGTGGYFNVGGILGFGECALDTCTNEGKVSLSSSLEKTSSRPAVGGLAGGIAGTAAITAKDCVNKGSVDLTGMFTNGGSGADYAAGGAGTIWASCGGCFGIVGDNTKLVQNCDNYGVITINTKTTAAANSAHSYGGIAGRSFAELNGCDNLAPTMQMDDIVATWHAGGIVGHTKNAIVDCKLGAKISLSHDCSFLTDKQSAAIVNFGGIVGYAAAGSSLSGCSAESSASLTFTNMASTVRIGCIAGMLYGPASDCTNNANLVFTRKNIEGVAFTNFVGGVIGYNYADANNGALDKCVNHGTVTVNLDKDSGAAAVGGVAGAFNKTNILTNCVNDAKVTIDGKNMSGAAVYAGGVIARTMATKSCLTDCSNSADLVVSNIAFTGWNYIGGLQGTYSSSGNVLTRCSNSGNVSVDGPAKLRVAGLNGALYGSFVDCTNTGNVTVNNPAAGSAIGGFAGYGSASISGGSFSGKITVNNAGGTCYSGLAYAQVNRTNTISGFKVDGSITGSNLDAGILFGVRESASYPAHYTLGAESSPLTILASSNINGTPVVSNPSTDADLVGNCTLNAPADDTDPILIYTNVVIE